MFVYFSNSVGVANVKDFGDRLSTPPMYVTKNRGGEGFSEGRERFARGDRPIFEGVMVKVLSWNIQCGRGLDDRIDLPRIAGVIRQMADFDVICLQEVCRFDDTLTGGDDDQVEALNRLFDDYNAYFGAADRSVECGWWEAPSVWKHDPEPLTCSPNLQAPASATRSGKAVQTHAAPSP